MFDDFCYVLQFWCELVSSVGQILMDFPLDWKCVPLNKFKGSYKDKNILKKFIGRGKNTLKQPFGLKSDENYLSLNGTSADK